MYVCVKEKNVILAPFYQLIMVSEFHTRFCKYRMSDRKKNYCCQKDTFWQRSNIGITLVLSCAITFAGSCRSCLNTRPLGQAIKHLLGVPICVNVMEKKICRLCVILAYISQGLSW